MVGIGWYVGGAIAGAILFALVAAVWQIRRRRMERWLPAYLRERQRYQPPKADDEVHVLLCIADHFEPKAGGASFEVGRQRVAAWVEQYPKQFGRFKDADGRPPRYTFFFPAEEYEKEYLDALANLCRAGFGEVEIHLHHDQDTADGLREKLTAFRDVLVNAHGLLSRHRTTGAVRYGFIHGNWTLCNARADGRLCGVNNEIPVLLETGCYADFTFPSAPSETQPPIINRIYFASDRPGQARSHEFPLADGAVTDNSLLMVQGPLLLDWGRRKLGFLPGVENGCLQKTQPPSLARLLNWLEAHVQVPSRPDWYFVKLHAHGAPEHDQDTLLGTPMVQFHEELAQLARENPKIHFHYVTAREMVNCIKAAQAGYTGGVAGALDWEIVSNLDGGRETASELRRA